MAERKLEILGTDNGSGVEVAESPEPANGEKDSEQTPVKSLTKRMMAIRADASGIGKEEIKMESKGGSKYSIKAHTIEGVLHGVRALFDKHGVWMQPNLVSREYTGNRCDVLMDFYFENVDDSKDRKCVRFAGAGTDNSDKGFAKAGTNALKEMLKKVFLITDREDAKEEEDRTDYQSEQGASRADLEAANEKARAALEQWAKAFKLALQNAGDKKTIERLERENKDQLLSAPDVTRDFFVELIQERKAALA